MKNLIKNILLEYVQGMDEIEHGKGGHSIERLEDRILVDKPVLAILVEYKPEMKKFWRTKVGMYEIPQSIKDKIQSNIDYMREFDVPLDENYAVILHEFNINRSDIEFFNDDLKIYTLKSFLNSEDEGFYGNKFFIKAWARDGSYSMGDVVVAIVENNTIITIEITNSTGMSQSKFKGAQIIRPKDLDRLGVRKGF